MELTCTYQYDCSDWIDFASILLVLLEKEPEPAEEMGSKRRREEGFQQNPKKRNYRWWNDLISRVEGI